LERITNLWREPLLHFLLLGCALFVYYDLAGDNVEAPPKRVHVERGQVPVRVHPPPRNSMRWSRVTCARKYFTARRSPWGSIATIRWYAGACA
jgi:hypothetical protein